MTEPELERAVVWVREFLDAHQDEIVAMARGRFAEGVFRYPTGPLFRKTRDELAADIAEELADALVYAARRLEMP